MIADGRGIGCPAAEQNGVLSWRGRKGGAGQLTGGDPGAQGKFRAEHKLKWEL